MEICKCIGYRIPGPINNEVPYALCSCDCPTHTICSSRCKLDVIACGVNLYHPNICPKSHSTEKSSQLGFYGEGFHFGLEIEFKFPEGHTFTNMVNDFIDIGLNKYYIITLEPSVENGVEFVSAPMNYYFHTLTLPKLYQLVKQHNLETNEKTGIHVHLTKTSTNISNLKDYLLHNEKEIDIFAGRKANMFCDRKLSLEGANNKQCAIRETNHTIEIRIFKTFEKVEEVLQKLRVLEKICL